MIADLTPAESDWLKAFFSSPNAIDWDSLERHTAPQEMIDQILPWMQLLGDGAPKTPIILPFFREGEIIRWYATSRGQRGHFELKSEIMAWLGPSYLNHFEVIPSDANDVMAAAMRQRFGGEVFCFSGNDRAINAKIARQISVYAGVNKRRNATFKRPVRPVGAIRSDFERALLVQDSQRAEALIEELRQTGRLNEENLKYLDVRLKAGLGLWPQIARDHWLIKTLSDLPLPVQILADLIESLYRTYLEDIELTGDAVTLLDKFGQHLATPYPRLFASRHGIKVPSVVKSFLLYERSQKQPDPNILADLAALLSPLDSGLPVYSALVASSEARTVPEHSENAAEDAFDDGQLDRAFALFLAMPLSKRSVQRLISCALDIGTDEARLALLGKVEMAESGFLNSLSDSVSKKIEGLRKAKGTETSPAYVAVSGWMAWAERLRDHHDVNNAVLALDGMLTWDVTAFARDEFLSRRFADLVGNLAGEPALVARRAVPAIYNGFFPPGQPASQFNKAIAGMLFDLIVLDEAISGTDLELLSVILSQILAFGVSTKEYISLLQDLEDVQTRIGSYAYLAWSLDVCEMLAIAPAPSEDGKDARLRFFLRLVGQAQGFAHRLERQDILLFEFLRRDYDVDSNALGAIRSAEHSEVNSAIHDLSGRMIAIYTLAETAGNRAKQALEAMFPGVKVDLNSDTVATARLSSLAKAADIFVFAWKSSSHQAYYCIKAALVDREPVMATGKGTASILRAVLDALN